MLTPEELDAILERILANTATEADVATLRRSLKQSGKVVQIELQQEKFSFDIEQISGGEIQFGDRIYQGADAETIKAVLQSVLIEQQKTLEQQKAKRPRIERDFLGMMKAEVVDSLKQSLHHAVLINLGKEEQPEQVERLWDAKIKVADQPNVLLPSDTKTIEVFEREDIAGRLLILGNPGSGKTTTLLELAKALIERAEMEQDFPMPVLFNLSSWKDDKQPLHEWMMQELKLRVRSDITRKWLANHNLLPLLDGLDEMASDRQETCVKAINQQLLTGEKSLPYLVVCSRNEEYDHYETRLLLNGAVSIQALTIEKIQSYLNSIDQVEFCHTLDRDLDLLALVRTPLFLSIAALSFQELSQERWQTLTTTEARIEYLLDSYIRQMLERPIPRNMLGKWQPPSNQKTRRWLVWLAQQMQKESQFEFLIERIQPSWLSNNSQEQIYLLFQRLIHGFLLIFTLCFVLFAYSSSILFDIASGDLLFFCLTLLKFLLVSIFVSVILGSGMGLTFHFVDHFLFPNFVRMVNYIFPRPHGIYLFFSVLLMLLPSSIFILGKLVFPDKNSLSADNGRQNNKIELPEIRTFEVMDFSVQRGVNSAIKNFINILSGLGGIALYLLLYGSIKNMLKFLNIPDALFGISVVVCMFAFVFFVLFNLFPKDEFIEPGFTFTGWMQFSCGAILGSIAQFLMWLLDSMFEACRQIFGEVSFGVFLIVVSALFFLLSIVGFIIFSGFYFSDIKSKTIPNEGIYRSASNFSIISLNGGFAVLLLGFFGFPKIVLASNSSQLIMLIVFISYCSVLPLIMSCGGNTCRRHFSLRLTLWLYRLAPWNYARFLNYCTERSLLQRVGGRYQFIHRLLQDHFAAMPFTGIEGDRQRLTP